MTAPTHDTQTSPIAWTSPVRKKTKGVFDYVWDAVWIALAFLAVSVSFAASFRALSWGFGGNR